MQIETGALRAYYLFDVADTIDLGSLRSIAGGGLARAPLVLRQHTSQGYLQFPVPPLVALLADQEYQGQPLAVRVKLFDYGVISVRLTLRFSGSWSDFSDAVVRFRQNEELLDRARRVASDVQDEIGAALDDPHVPLMEDYLVVEIERFTNPITGAQLLGEHASALATLLLGETRALSSAEVEETLRSNFSYYPDDCTIVQWDTAFVYDRRDSADAIEDILEFANSQLLELRTYDQQLDDELNAIYATQPGRTTRGVLGRRVAERAASLRYLIVDVLELTDRASNALKVIGDAYYARVYRAAARRLGLADWQKQIDSKLASIGDMYRFFHDESRNHRDEFLELIVIILIALELVVGVVTLLHH